MSPDTVQEVRVVVHFALPGEAATVKAVIAVPPVSAGVVHTITEEPFVFDVAVTPVGAPGTVAGMAAGDAVDAAELPAALMATTLNV